MSDSESGDAIIASDPSPLGHKIGASAVVLLLAVPGLVIEPGPLSEATAVILLLTIWFEDPNEIVE